MEHLTIKVCNRLNALANTIEIHHVKFWRIDFQCFLATINGYCFHPILLTKITCLILCLGTCSLIIMIQSYMPSYFVDLPLFRDLHGSAQLFWTWFSRWLRPAMILKGMCSRLRFLFGSKKMNKDLCYGIMTVVGVTLIHHTFGFLYASSKVANLLVNVLLGDLVPYLQDYFNTSSGTITFYTSSLFACEAISTPLGAMLSGVIGFRWSTFISILLTR